MDRDEPVTVASDLSGALPAVPIALRLGDRMPERRLPPLTLSDIVRYAGAAGDFNPLHHDEPSAHAAGHPSVFAMGLLQTGVLGMQLARWVGPENIRTFRARYTAQVWPGDQLTVTGEVIEVHGDGRALLSLEVNRQTGEVAIRAAATVLAASQGTGTTRGQAEHGQADPRR